MMAIPGGVCLSTVAALDRIVVLGEATIVEDGTHAELSLARGTYESLWDRQTGTFLEADQSISIAPEAI